MEKNMEFIEYPKALYRAGEMLIVADAEQEAAAREAGHADWHADQAAMQAPAEPELDREALKARAAELGIVHAQNIKTEKLAELVAAAEQ